MKKCKNVHKSHAHQHNFVEKFPTLQTGVCLLSSNISVSCAKAGNSKAKIWHLIAVSTYIWELDTAHLTDSGKLGTQQHNKELPRPLRQLTIACVKQNMVLWHYSIMALWYYGSVAFMAVHYSGIWGRGGEANIRRRVGQLTVLSKHSSCHIVGGFLGKWVSNALCRRQNIGDFRQGWKQIF